MLGAEKLAELWSTVEQECLTKTAYLLAEASLLPELEEPLQKQAAQPDRALSVAKNVRTRISSVNFLLRLSGFHFLDVILKGSCNKEAFRILFAFAPKLLRETCLVLSTESRPEFAVLFQSFNQLLETWQTEHIFPTHAQTGSETEAESLQLVSHSLVTLSNARSIFALCSLLDEFIRFAPAISRTLLENISQIAPADRLNQFHFLDAVLRTGDKQYRDVIAAEGLQLLRDTQALCRNSDKGVQFETLITCWENELRAEAGTVNATHMRVELVPPDQLLTPTRPEQSVSTTALSLGQPAVPDPEALRKVVRNLWPPLSKPALSRKNQAGIELLYAPSAPRCFACGLHLPSDKALQTHGEWHQEQQRLAASQESSKGWYATGTDWPKLQFEHLVKAQAAIRAELQLRKQVKATPQGPDDIMEILRPKFNMSRTRGHLIPRERKRKFSSKPDNTPPDKTPPESGILTLRPPECVSARIRKSRRISRTRRENAPRSAKRATSSTSQHKNSSKPRRGRGARKERERAPRRSRSVGVAKAKPYP